jgi:hypothetical protein
VDQRLTYIYDNLIAKRFDLKIQNIAISGSSNHTIFMRSAAAIQSQQYDLVFTQWSALNRVWLYPGPDCYFFLNDQKYPDFRYRDIYLSEKDKKRFRDTLLILNHDYQNIIDLIDYCKILAQLGSANNTKIVFVNGLVPWTDDLVHTLTDDLAMSLSEYSKSMLEFDNRHDKEIIAFFKKLQKKFIELDQNKWVNLFDSFFKNTIDTGPEGHHPGIKSHQWMADQISNYIIENKII